MAKKQASKTSSKKGNMGKALAVGAGVVALSAAAYAFFGPNGKANRKKVKGWVASMQKEVRAKLKDMKTITEPIYNKVIDDVSKKYAKAKGVGEAEVKIAVTELKRYWKDLVQESKAKANTTKRSAKKAVKKAVKKATKKMKK